MAALTIACWGELT